MLAVLLLKVFRNSVPPQSVVRLVYAVLYSSSMCPTMR
jgi:hypothetical protein